MNDSIPSIQIRHEIVQADLEIIREIVAATGKFNLEEIDIAVELGQERLTRGPASGYEFVLAEQVKGSSSQHSAATGDDEPSVIGFACFGRIPCTQTSFDLYWIAVHPQKQTRGVGRFLLQEVQQKILSSGGTHLYADTSGRPDYVETRKYYLANGFQQAALLEDFYAVGDDKVIYRKPVGARDLTSR